MWSVFTIPYFVRTVDPSTIGTQLWRRDRIPSADNGYQGQNTTGFVNDEVTRLLGEAELHQRRGIIRRRAPQGLELFGGPIELAQHDVRFPQIEPGVCIVRLASQPLAQVRDHVLDQRGRIGVGQQRRRRPQQQLRGATAIEFEFENGGKLNWNTTVSVGASWRAEDPSRELYTRADGSLIGLYSAPLLPGTSCQTVVAGASSSVADWRRNPLPDQVMVTRPELGPAATVMTRTAASATGVAVSALRT